MTTFRLVAHAYNYSFDPSSELLFQTVKQLQPIMSQRMALVRISFLEFG
jgi:hypothetical protein